MNVIERLKKLILNGGSIVDFIRSTPWGEIADFPDWEDQQDVQRWLGAVLVGADEAADLTETDADDLIIHKCQDWIESDMFGLVHMLLVRLLRDDGELIALSDESHGAMLAEATDDLREDAIAAGFPVWLIPILIEGAIELAKWIRKRREG